MGGGGLPHKLGLTCSGLGSLPHKWGVGGLAHRRVVCFVLVWGLCPPSGGLCPVLAFLPPKWGLSVPLSLSVWHPCPPTWGSLPHNSGVSPLCASAPQVGGGLCSSVPLSSVFLPPNPGLPAPQPRCLCPPTRGSPLPNPGLSAPQPRALCPPTRGSLPPNCALPPNPGLPAP